MPYANSSSSTSVTQKRPAAEDRAISPPPLKRKAQSAISKSAVANFFTPVSQKPKSRTVWSERAPDGDATPTLLVGVYTPESGDDEPRAKRRKVAAFDLDSTLITTSSGKKHGDNGTDWKWWHSSVPSRLKQLYYEEGFRLVILTNQAGLTLHPDPKAKLPKNHKDRVAFFKQKAAAVASQLDIPLTIYAATGKDIFRKPRPGMWDAMRADYGLDDPDGMDLQNSMFIGDAGGRVATAKAPKDFSCSDRNLAHNVGVRFATPEEYFLGEKPREWIREFDLEKFPYVEPVEGENGFIFEKENEKEVVLFCGPPGAGKSTFFFKHLEPLGYERVNQDTLRSKEKCFNAANGALEEGDSVAVDNTNADPDTRAQWIELAKKRKVPIRCVWFNTPLQLCEHNDAVRALIKAMNPESRTGLPKLAFNGFNSRFVPPKVKEGFQEVIKVDFQFRGTKEEYEIWGRYWL